MLYTEEANFSFQKANSYGETKFLIPDFTDTYTKTKFLNS